MTRSFTAAAIVLSVLASSSAGSQEATSPGALDLDDCRIRAGEGFPGIKARCGIFSRPENPSDPDSPLLELFVAVVPALSLEPDPDPLIPIAGGPGQASTEFYASIANAFEPVRRNRDIVLLDQRGTGKSAPMLCELDDEVAEIEFSVERTIASTERCLQQLPHDPRFFTTSLAVQDLEALRIALGYEKFNVYGISYGTRVAQHYLRRYPESVRTVVLDGVVPPQLALGPGIAIDAQNALDAIFARCAESDSCGERFPNLQNDFAALRARLATEPAQIRMADPLTGTNDDIRFDENDMAGALRLLSYHPSTVALIPFLIDQAVSGNYQPLAAQFLMVSSNLSDSINIGMHNAVVCTEDAPYFESAEVTIDELEATYIGALQLRSLETICSVWPKGIIDAGFKDAVASEVPVLLLSGEADPVTPPGYADLAAVDLGNFTHLTGAKQGHGQAPRGCVADVIGRFVESADLASIDAACMERLHAMPFFLDFAGPSP